MDACNVGAELETTLGVQQLSMLEIAEFRHCLVSSENSLTKIRFRRGGMMLKWDIDVMRENSWGKHVVDCMRVHWVSLDLKLVWWASRGVAGLERWGASEFV